jgi:hypothetical protein
MVLRYNDRLALPTNIRLWWQEMVATNTLAYYIAATMEQHVLDTYAGKQLS